MKISEIERKLKSIHQWRVIDEIKIGTNRKNPINILEELGAELDKDWIAIKEAAVPSLIGLAVLATTKTQKPLVRLFLYNKEIVDVVRVDLELDKRGNRTAFEQLMEFCTFLLAASFFLSASLNYLLAKYLIRSESGTDAFNMELGKMTFWSYPVILIPSMVVMSLVLWKLLSGIKALTGLNTEEIFRISRD